MPMDEQRAVLRSCMDNAMRQYVKSAINIREEDNITTDDIIQKMMAHFRSKTNIAVDRVAFAKRKQEPGETFDAFYV